MSFSISCCNFTKRWEKCHLKSPMYFVGRHHNLCLLSLALYRSSALENTFNRCDACTKWQLTLLMLKYWSCEITKLKNSVSKAPDEDTKVSLDCIDEVIMKQKKKVCSISMSILYVFIVFMMMVCCVWLSTSMCISSTLSWRRASIQVNAIFKLNNRDKSWDCN